jgi:hypothetical protein
LTHALLKARKKESKSIKNLVETEEECAAAFEAYSQHAHASDGDAHAEEWAGILDISARMENQMTKLFQDLVRCCCFFSSLLFSFFSSRKLFFSSLSFLPCFSLSTLPLLTPRRRISSQ